LEAHTGITYILRIRRPPKMSISCLAKLSVSKKMIATQLPLKPVPCGSENPRRVSLGWLDIGQKLGPEEVQGTVLAVEPVPKRLKGRKQHLLGKGRHIVTGALRCRNPNAYRLPLLSGRYEPVGAEEWSQQKDSAEERITECSTEMKTSTKGAVVEVRPPRRNP
jgi:hypothetical protein